jgi:hypothetical protein
MTLKIVRDLQGSSFGGIEMALLQYTKDEIVQRGEALYERKIRSNVEDQHRGKILVIDLESEDYEVDEDHLAANRRLRDRHPEGTFYGLRIGYPALGKVGGGWGQSRP